MPGKEFRYLAGMRLEFSSEIPASADDAFAWHGRPGAFERLVPPWQGVALEAPHPGVFEGSEVRLAVSVGPFRQRWTARHLDVVPGRQFVDEQVAGPFASWRHCHRFEPLSDERCRLVDEIEAALPGGPAGRLLEPWLARTIRRSFRYRHRITALDLGCYRRWKVAPRMTVAMTGASGLIGRALGPMLTAAGHRVVALVRGSPGPGQRRWNPAGATDPAVFTDVDAVIHLAGENLAAGRWTARRKAALRSSRVDGTAGLVDAVTRATPRPRVFISASGIGVYGDRGDAVLTEQDPPGPGFLGDLATAWEAATDPLVELGVRRVVARFGIVLSPTGGALASMLPAFRLGLGARLGTGRQWMSWLGIDDCCAAIVDLLCGDYSGPVNLTAPQPVTNAAFTSTLARVLGRPAFLAAPAPILRLVLGEMADEALLASGRAVPTALANAGFGFAHPDLEVALRHVLGREAP